MKQFLLASLLSISLLSWSPKPKSSTAKNKEYFKVEVVQNGKVLKPKKNIISLKKEPFKFKLTYYKTDFVYVSCSWGTYYYDYPNNKNICECNDDTFLKDCRFVSIKTGNEEKFNVNKDIYVGDGDYQNVWFYEHDMDWYRMDKGVTVKDGVIHAEVTVEHIFDMDKRDERTFEKSEYNYPIEKIDKDIYVVFATSHYEKGMEHAQELQRQKILLKFN